MPKTFSLEEQARLLDFMASDDLRFEYITALQAYGEAGHNCREPFSLLPIDVPAPILDEDLDEEAERRALYLLKMQFMLPEDSNGMMSKDVFCQDIDMNGKTLPATVEFVVRCVWWTAVYLGEAREKPAEWYAEMGEYLRVHWPLYDGRPVTDDLISDWNLWVTQLERERAKPQSFPGRVLFEIRERISSLMTFFSCYRLYLYHRNRRAKTTR